MIRIADIILSLLTIIILSPLFLIVIIILAITGDGEIFYRQKRVGLRGELFGVFKFATMAKNSEKTGTGLITIKGDPRVFPFGRFLRKTKINEFPQIFNILIGDMSFVGPRPQVPPHFEAFREHVKKELIKIKPGLTGIGSIVFRDEEGILEKNKSLTYEECYSNVIAPYKGELELWYLKKKSFGLYLTLIFVTAWVVVFSDSKIFLKLFNDLPQPPVEINI
ncbi:MAG: sugar transferase [Bacteroidetes bacterium]|nr:sugar transferase [Bacteroidota bacterium]